MTALSILNLQVFRGDRHVLRDLSFSVSAGTCLRVVGPNGCGKTTLLRTICGLVEIEAGTVHWHGRNIADDRGAFNADLSYFGHDLAQKLDLTVRENLRYAVGIRRLLSLPVLATALKRLLLEPLADLPLRVLSAGQRRRVQLAALWLTGSRLWVLDEPNTNLDLRGQALVASLIEEQLAQGGVVLAALHQDLPLRSGNLQTLQLGDG